MDSKDILRRVGETLNRKNEDSKRDKEQTERERREVVSGVAKDVADAIKPYLEGMAQHAQITKEDLKAAMSEIQINVPESNVNIPEFNIPTPQVTVNVPETKFPDIQFPKNEYPTSMSVGLEKVSREAPLPVMLMDTLGKPFVFSFPAGSGGGKSDHFTVKGITQTVGMVAINPDGSPAGAGSVASSVSVTDIFGTTGTNVVNPDGRLKVELPTGSSGITDTEIRATALPVSQLSGASWSTSASIVSITDIFSTTATSNVVNPDNRVKVELPTGSSGLTDTELRATSLTVNQLSGARWSTEATQSGTWNIGTVASITASTAVSLTDSTGVQYSGSNPAPVTLISGALQTNTTVLTRQANPTAVAADYVPVPADDLGRVLIRPMQVRDLMRTAYVSVANGTETTLLAAAAGAYHDLIFIKGSNNSDAAVSVDIRAVTAGNIIDTLRIPANGTVGYTLPVPYPQDETGNNWTVDGPDETGRTLTFSALFSREI